VDTPGIQNNQRLEFALNVNRHIGIRREQENEYGRYNPTKTHPRRDE
jgi:hypothetical protein